MSNPYWRKVVKADGPYAGRGSLLGPETSRRVKWWDLTLECGHLVQRSCRYPPPFVPGRRHRSAGEALPPPKRVLCEMCAAAPASC